jgi:hypothetical protein
VFGRVSPAAWPSEFRTDADTTSVDSLAGSRAATLSRREGAGPYTLPFAQDVSACDAVATLASSQAGRWSNRPRAGSS